MVGSIRRMLLGLACLLRRPLAPATACRRRALRPIRRGGSRLAKADGATLFALPGEDPPPPFVPLHPQTVEQRQLIEAVTDYSAARAFEHENLWSDAIDLLEKALRLEPDSAAILKRLSSLCLALGKIDQGLKYGKRVLEADPGDTDTISQLVAHYAKNDPGAAETLLKDVLANPRLDKNSPGYLLAELELGKLYWDKLRQVDQAADAFAKVVEALDEKAANRLSPADQKRILGGDERRGVVYLEFGVVFLAAKRYDLAIKAFQRGLVYDEDDPQLLCFWRRPCSRPARARRRCGGRGVPQAPAAGGRGLRPARQDPDRAASRERDHPPARGRRPGRLQEHPAPVHPGRPLPRDRPGREGRADVQGAAGRAADHSRLRGACRVALQAEEDRGTAQGHDRGRRPSRAGPRRSRPSSMRSSTTRPTPTRCSTPASSCSRPSRRASTPSRPSGS